MKKAQFVSPIIILAIVIISTFIILTQRRINEATTDMIIGLNPILTDMENITMQDLSYQNNITKKILETVSTSNNFGTITAIIRQEYDAVLLFANEILVNYSKKYYAGSNSMIINNTIIVPYPYNTFRTEEQRFITGLSLFSSCMGTDCANFNSCVKNYDTIIVDFVPISCEIGPPIRVRIELIDNEYPLTLNYTYHMYNNNPIIIG